MAFLREKFAKSPIYARVAPYVIFLILTQFQGQLGEDSKFWVYIAKTVVGAWIVWEMRAFVQEMRWAVSWEGVVVGVAIFGVWVGLDGWYPRMGDVGEGWNPFKEYGNSLYAWLLVVVRIVGSSVVVPPLEEAFYRSFLYRYFVKLNFLALPMNYFHGLSFFVTSALFGLMHPDRWLAGIICGLAYQWLVIRKNRLGDAMLAHGITNFLLGIYILWKGDAWNFW